jgi:hypothetical protein
MPHLTHPATARRDRNLLRIRKLSLWTTAGAAAVSLGLGTAFAHALPGHTHSAATRAGNTGSQNARPAPRQQAGDHHPRADAGRSRGHGLARPQQRPAPAPAQTHPAVSSGGS